jgi:GNAT superfamily N-acetyltransferase
VVHRVDPKVVGRDPRGWLADVELALSKLQVSLSRIYLMEPCRPLETTLRRAGYQSRMENGYVRPAEDCSQTDITLRPITSEEDWARKHWVHSQFSGGGDGYQLDPGTWIQLVRRKADTGRKLCFLIERGSQLCGTVAAIDMPSLVRAKNLVVLPGLWRTGVGTGVMEALAARALAAGQGAIGAYGIANHAGDALYPNTGFRRVSAITEWTHTLEGVQE